MSLSPGTRLGPYEVVGALGAGGMGEVYRARDPRLGRDVAIKVLPAAFSADRDRLQRFEQEARAAAALNHPNILAVHDIGTHDGSPYIVSELLEGETLRERLHAGALPVRKAIDYGVQIAHGLAAAHDKGITHRDLKPENLFVTTDDRVKVLDFGLAKLTQRESALAIVSSLPTAPAGSPASAPDTVPGMVMGTVGYMAPEQVRGVAADSRADVFALGAVLYEMLSGQRAFRGDTVMDSMTAILKEDPPPLPMAERRIPPALERIVYRCLEKNAAARFQSTRDLAFALESASTPADSSTAAARAKDVLDRPAAPAARTRERVFAGLAALFLLTTVATWTWAGRSTPSPNVVRFSLEAPAGSATRSFALSPDGRRVAFGTTRLGVPAMLYLRPLDALAPTPLPGTEGGKNPFWSPDGTAIGFFADNKLKIIELASNSVRTLCDAAGARTWGDWHANGVILFSLESGQPVYRVPATGGQPLPATRVSSTDGVERVGHYRPAFLPDGRRFLYSARPIFIGAESELRLASIDGTRETLLLKPASGARYVEPGYLVFIRGTELMAQRFDANSGTLSGTAVSIGSVGSGFSDASPSDSGFSVAGSSALAFHTIEQDADIELVWFTRSGERISQLGDRGIYRNPQLSPDGTRLAVQQLNPGDGRSDVWVFDVARGVRTRLTLEGATTRVLPLWSPDGAGIIVRSIGTGKANGVVRWPSTGAGAAELLSASAFDPNSYSPDGQYLVYTVLNPTTNRDIGLLPLSGDRTPSLLLQSTADETHGRLSPDGKWIAYESDEAGGDIDDIYIQSFPTGGQKVRVSTAGGVQARWRRDGRELFFIAPDNTLMAVAVETLPTLTVGTPTPLFETRMIAGGGIGTNANYDVTPDGQRFIIASRTGDATSAPINVVLNWLSALPE